MYNYLIGNCAVFAATNFQQAWSARTNRRLRKKAALKAMEQYQLSLTYRLCQSESQARFAIRKEINIQVLYVTLCQEKISLPSYIQKTYYC